MMHSDRRLLLKGLAAAGLVISGAGWTQLAGATAKPAEADAAAQAEGADDVLALTSAFAHACFGAIQKGRHDPWVTRGAIDLWIMIFAAPVALFVVPWPQGAEWLVLLGALVIHFARLLSLLDEQIESRRRLI